MQSLQSIDIRFPNLHSKGNDGQSFDDTSFERHWGYIIALDNLSNSNPLLWDELTEKNVIWFLNVLTYYNDKQKTLAERERLRSNIK